MSEPIDEYVAAEAAEWNTFVAVQDIFFEGQPAYRAGQPVPVANVALHGYDRDGLVRRVDGEPIGEFLRAPEVPDPAADPNVTVIDAPSDLA